MKIKLYPTVEEVLETIPRREGVEITTSGNTIEVIGLTSIEEEDLKIKHPKLDIK